MTDFVKNIIIHKQVIIHIKIHPQIMILKGIQMEKQIKIQILQSLPTLL